MGLGGGVSRAGYVEPNVRSRDRARERGECVRCVNHDLSGRYCCVKTLGYMRESSLNCDT